MKKKKACHRLPPHSWETHHLANKGEANKTLVIAIVAVVVLVGLVLLLFVGKQFVGKAVSFGEIGLNTVGVGIPSGTQETGESFILPVKVNLGEGLKSVALSFSLLYDYNTIIVDCNEDSILSLLDKKFKGTENGDAYDLSFSRKVTCENGKVEVEYSGLCKDADCTNAVTGKETIAEIKFTPSTKGDYLFDFGNLILKDFGHEGNLPVTKVAAIIAVTEKPGCGNGALEHDEQCDGNLFDLEKYSSDCTTYGFIHGTASCDNCKINFASCEYPLIGEPCADVSLPDGTSVKGGCASGLSCKEGVCAKEETSKNVCIDSDGMDTITKGNVLFNGKSYYDACSGEDVNEYICEESSSSVTAVIVPCASGTSCNDGACVSEEIPVEEVPAPEIIIELTPKSGASVFSVTKSITYNVKATITPNAALPANHLAIVTLNYGLEQRVIMVETKSPLAVGGTETLAFEHTVNDAAGPLEVKVSIWNTWPSSGETWTNLVPPAEKSYTIQ